METSIYVDVVHNSDADRLGRRQISRKNVLFKEKKKISILSSNIISFN